MSPRRRMNPRGGARLREEGGAGRGGEGGDRGRGWLGEGGEGETFAKFAAMSGAIGVTRRLGLTRDGVSVAFSLVRGG